MRWILSLETPPIRSLSSAYAFDSVRLQLDQILSKAARDVSKFANVALVDVDSQDLQVYVNYFDITFIPSTVFVFNAHHMKRDSGQTKIHNIGARLVGVDNFGNKYYGKLEDT